MRAFRALRGESFGGIGFTGYRTFASGNGFVGSFEYGVGYFFRSDIRLLLIAPAVPLRLDRTNALGITPHVVKRKVIACHRLPGYHHFKCVTYNVPANTPILT